MYVSKDRGQELIQCAELSYPCHMMPVIRGIALGSPYRDFYTCTLKYMGRC